MSDDQGDDERPGGINLDALLAFLTDRPSLFDEAPDMVALAQTLARAIDDDAGVGYCSECKRGGLTAALAGQYVKVLDALRGQSAGDGDGADELGDRLSSPVGNPADRPPDAR